MAKVMAKKSVLEHAAREKIMSKRESAITLEFRGSAVYLQFNLHGLVLRFSIQQKGEIKCKKIAIQKQRA